MAAVEQPDSLSQRLAASTSRPSTSPTPSPIPADTYDSDNSSDYTDDDEYDDDHAQRDPFEYDTSQALVMVVPILIPMLAKMLGRYVTISLMRRYFTIFG
ncbi:hypothetical protein DFJ77DRAFT_506159 [Powellomyces hirtus]|nr:hypothetical protein DFJ77DRAFT_506159 [Powellomyces hirtus]